MAITQLPPLSLYIHFPWCVEKCPYCDFNSHTVKTVIPEDLYIDALLNDLDQELPSIWGRQLTSIFIGGGTPSLISSKGIDRLLSGIRARLPFLSDMEVTIEANPGTAEANKFHGFYQAGVNRISIGVQSFRDKYLKTLGRIHSSNEAINAFKFARKAGFTNINLDLMYALPGQTIEQAIEDLSIAIELQPEHLSWYQLTLEPNTPFYNKPPKQIPNDDLRADISERGMQFLQDNNYQQYEVSAYSLNGRSPSLHNCNYWQFGDYLAIGAGAHSKITRADTQQITRTSRLRNPKDYLNKDKNFVSQTRVIKPQEFPIEFMMNAMRLKDGVAKELFFQTTGLLLSQIEDSIKQCEEKGLMVRENNFIKPTTMGFNFLNNILELFNENHFPNLDSSNNIKITEL